MTASNFSSTDVLFPPAMATGKLTLIANAMAREVTVDAQGRATGVSYIDKTTGTDKHVRARVVVLAASALESARLLLNSKSTHFPNGLANSSGIVGKYITDTTGADVGGFIPRMVDQVPHNDDGVGGRARLHAVVAGQQEARLPARLPHRSLGRPPHAVVRLHGRHPATSHPAAATASR